MTDADRNAFRKAETLLDAGQSEQALRALARLIAIDPDDSDTLTAIGRANLHLRRYDDAIIAIERAIAIAPGHASAWDLLAIASSSVGRHSKAVHAALTASQLAPFNHWLQANVAITTAAAGVATGKTVAQAKRAIELAPYSGYGHYALGVVWQSLGRSRKAKRSFREALRIEPTNSDAQHELAIVHYQQGRIGSSVRVLADVLASDPSHERSRQTVVVASDRVLIFVLLWLWLYIGVLGFANMWSPPPSGSPVSSGQGLPYATLLTRALLVLGLSATVGGYLLWFRVTVGPRFRPVLASLYSRDRLQAIWTGLLGLIFLAEVATTVFGSPLSMIFLGISVVSLVVTTMFRLLMGAIVR